MSGKSIQIFSMMTLGMALWNPIKAVLGVNQSFQRFDVKGVDLFLPKLLFCALQIAVFSIAVWKCQVLGLLPSGFPLPDLSQMVSVRESSFAQIV